MPDATLMHIMAAAIVVAAAAILVQTGLLFSMHASSKAIRERVDALARKAEPVLDGAQRVVREAEGQLHDIGVKTNEVLDLSRKQLVRIDDVLADAASRTRVQLDRVEMVLDETITRFQETATSLHNGILKPVRQINALAAGVAAVFSWLGRGHRTSPERATHDEEMFI